MAARNRPTWPLPCCDHGGQQLLKRCAELLQAVIEEAIVYLLQSDVVLVERVEDRSCAVDVAIQRLSDASVIAKRVVRRRRHRVDGLGADQFLDIVSVAIRGILGPRTGPQQSLGARPLFGKRLPGRTLQDLPVLLIGQFGVRNCRLPLRVVAT